MTNYTDLSNLINKTLPPLISGECVIFDAPYHENIGDILIFEGEMNFLQKHNIKCIKVASYNTCSFPKLKVETTILYHGGGNIGDLYHEHIEFLIKLIHHYPQNRIIVLPQTIFYVDDKLCHKDFQILSQHSDFIICARDNKSFSLANKAFTGRVLLLPDMAFCISKSILEKYLRPCIKEKLYILRRDEEFKKCGVEERKNCDISDWPCTQNKYMISTIGNKIFENLFKYLSKTFLPSAINPLWDKYFIHIHRFLLLKEGVKFISQYSTIYTQRLHGAILAILLEKEVKIMDNSYGKNSSFYDTWLKNMNNVKLINSIEENNII